MSEIHIPKRQIEMAKPNGNLYTYHLLDMELVPWYGKVQALAHLAITAPENIKDAKSELQDTLLFMHYSPNLRQKLQENKATPFTVQPLIFLDRYQKPSIKNNNRYFSALIAANEFELGKKRIEPPFNASIYDFVLGVHDEKGTGKYEGTKYLGL